MRPLARVLALAVSVDGTDATAVPARAVPSAVAGVALLSGPQPHVTVSLARIAAKDGRPMPRGGPGAPASTVVGTPAGRATHARTLPTADPSAHGEVPVAAVLTQAASTSVASVGRDVEARVATLTTGPASTVAVEATPRAETPPLPVAEVAKVPTSR